MDCIEFTVPGKPFGKQRPRVVHKNGYSRAYTPEKTATYENLVKVMYQQAARGQRFADGVPLCAEIVAYYAIPKGTSGKKRDLMIEGQIRPTKKPDLDNIEKVIYDSLNNIAYKDDSQVVKSYSEKFYGDIPRVDVKIYVIKPKKGGNRG
ncbi:MAG: RusA family crossover junction endodeoxyribonuclease [Clostridiales bacterium]|nr:RusA family crossover junction endodeoxyribonuclease [Clostridiales bacterium]